MVEDFAPFHFERARGGPKSLAEMALSGLERTNLDLAGEGTAPPIHYLTGMKPTEVGPGRMTFSMPPSDWLLSARGEISTTAAAFLSDAPLGGAVMSVLPGRTAIPTAELSLAFLEASADGAHDLSGKGSLIDHNETTAISRVDVSSGEVLLATGLTRVMIEPTLVLVPDRDTAGSDVQPPHLRPVLGEPVPDDVWPKVSGLDVLIGQASSELPLPPIAWLLGFRPMDVAEGAVSGRVIASTWVASPAGTLYGGFVAAVCEWAISAAAQTLAGTGGRERMLDVKVNYLRPLIPQGQLLGIDARLTHRGRRIVVGEGALSREDGKVIAQAVGTARLEQPVSE